MYVLYVKCYSCGTLVASVIAVPNPLRGRGGGGRADCGVPTRSVSPFVEMFDKY